MGPGFKYHIATIAAIFFALTVGLVVGSLFVSPRLVDRQTRLINSLKQTANEENGKLREKMRRYQEFVGLAAPQLLKGRLRGTTVAIVRTGDYPDAVTMVRETLQKAGARVLSVTTIERAFARPDEVLNADLVRLQEREPRFPTNRTELAEKIATILVKGDSPLEPLLPLLEQENYVRAEPNSLYTAGVRYVVLVTGRRAELSQRPTNVDLPLIRALQKAKVTVVACEPQNVPFSDLTAYPEMSLDLPSISEVDTEMGSCSLVFALREGRTETTAEETPSDSTNTALNRP